VEHVDHCTPVQRTVEDLGVREEDPVDSLLPGPPGQPALFRVHQTDRTPPRANPQAVVSTPRESTPPPQQQTRTRCGRCVRAPQDPNFHYPVQRVNYCAAMSRRGWGSKGSPSKERDSTPTLTSSPSTTTVRSAPAPATPTRTGSGFGLSRFRHQTPDDDAEDTTIGTWRPRTTSFVQLAPLGTALEVPMAATQTAATAPRVLQQQPQTSEERVPRTAPTRSPPKRPRSIVASAGPTVLQVRRSPRKTANLPGQQLVAGVGTLSVQRQSESLRT